MSDPNTQTRCLLCSLACPVAFEACRGNCSEVLTEYVASDPHTQGRLCFRGHYLAEMATHPFRLTGGELREAGAERAHAPAPMGQVIAALAECLRQAGKSAAIIVDGNLATEDIVAALRLAREAVGADRVCVRIPESDDAMLRGIRPGTRILSFDSVAECDLFLAIGDIFATHPVISRPVLEARAAKTARLFGIDCMPNRVAGFAEKFLCVKPGGEAPALAALCKNMGFEVPAGNAWAEQCSTEELSEMAGIGCSELQAVAHALAKAERPAVLLDPVPGRTGNIAAAASAASAICEGLGARLMPMFRYGNAAGAARAAATFGAASLSDIVEAASDAEVEVALSIGVDLMRDLPAEDAVKLRAAVATLAVASPFRNRSTEKADIVVPLAAWFEGRGSALDAAGNRLDLTPLLAPPGGALTAGELCTRVASAVGRPLSAAAKTPLGNAFLGSAVAAITTGNASEKAIQLVARSDIADFDTGSVSRILAWPRRMEPVPEVHMNPSDAGARGLAPREMVRLRANNSEARARLQIKDNVAHGTAAVSTAFAEIRALFPRTSRDRIDVTPQWNGAEVTAETEA